MIFITENKGIYILSVEAKDLYATERINSEQGYLIRDKNGNINIRKFINTLDYSLDSIKLKEVYEKKCRRKDFAFSINKKEYTKMVINVKFKYSYKEFNKVTSNIYIRDGYSYRDIKDKMKDLVYIEDNRLIAIETNKELNDINSLSDIKQPIEQDILGNYFTFENGMYVQKGNIPVLKSKAELREYLYKNGFNCDGLHYVRYKRSSGSSRVGKCLFVYDLLLPAMQKWDKCGLTIRKGDKIDLAAYEAYISLPLSSIIDTIEILPENILVIDDYESVFYDTVIAVENENDKLIANEKEMQITNSIWDGQSLMDISLFRKYKDKGMLLLRNRFFKTCAFNTNIQQFFKDNNITDIKQLKGKTLATNINDIKLITTPSSIKYLKFGTLDQWLRNIDITFGIVKYEKETHFFDGRMVQTHYQLLNTLQFNEKEIEELLQPSLDYINYVRSDPDILRYHIQYPFSGMDMSPINTKNEIIFKMLGINNKFAKTKFYYNFRNDLVRALIEKLKDGRILINGNYSTLFGNGLEMLKSSVGLFNGCSELINNQIHSKKFQYGITILGSRSPHVTMGNIALFENKRNENYDKYFNLTNEIVCINSINNNILQKLNGADFDSDTVLLTDNQFLIDKAKENYNKFKVPTCFVSAKKKERFYTDEHKADLDIKTSVNKIGEIINCSQQLNSLLWDRVSKDSDIDKEKELYEDICKLSVLSGVEIDRAKKEFTINSDKELKILKNKYKITNDNKIIKPMFFKRITLNNGYELSDRNGYRYFDTSMDFLQRVINKFNFRNVRKKKQDLIPFSEIIKVPTSMQNITNIRQGYYYNQVKRIMNIITYTKNNISAIYRGYDNLSKDDKSEVKRIANELKQECIDYINDISISEATMYLLLKNIEKDSKISGFVFDILFGTPNQTFFKMIINSKENLNRIKESKLGNIQLYDFLFLKEKIID